jgi:limonene-1,2-epoxide hydrolase
MEAKEAIRLVVDAWERLDPAALARLFTQDGVYEDPLKETILRGPGEIEKGNADAMGMLTSCRIELRHLVADGGTALAEGTFAAGTASAGTLDFPFAIVAELEDGKIRRLSEYFDTRPL